MRLITYIAAILLGLVLAIVLTGCGGSGFVDSRFRPNNAKCSSGFDNETGGQIDSATLNAFWTQAQSAVSTGVYLDATVTPPTNWVSDSRASGISPNCVAVYSVPDWTPQALATATGNPAWLNHSIPTGAIFEGGIALHSWTQLTTPETVIVAASELSNPGATGYEFQNVILNRLGYSLSGR